MSSDVSDLYIIRLAGSRDQAGKRRSTCLKAALYWTSSFEQLPVYSLFFTLSWNNSQSVVVVVVGAAQNLDVGFLKALECVDHCKEFCQVVNLFSFTRIAIQSNLGSNI